MAMGLLDSHGLSLQVVACDEDEVALDELVRQLNEDPRIGHVLPASDATSLLRIVNSHSRLDGSLNLGSELKHPIDAIFLDIRMRGLDGLELARVFSTLPVPPGIVFVTTYDDRAVDAFEVGSVDYLLKPTTTERLGASIDRIVAMVLQSTRSGSSEQTGRIFLCHSSGDKDRVRELYHLLNSDGLDCWFDEVDLLPGQDWELEIDSAIRQSQFVLACVSKASITKRGYIQKELKRALDVADEQPEGGIFLIPVRLEACTLPQRLQRWQWVDLYAPSGYEKLLRTLRSRVPGEAP